MVFQLLFGGQFCCIKFKNMSLLPMLAPNEDSGCPVAGSTAPDYETVECDAFDGYVKENIIYKKKEQQCLKTSIVGTTKSLGERNLKSVQRWWMQVFSPLRQNQLDALWSLQIP